MGVTFERVGEGQRAEVAEFLSAHEWSFHARPGLAVADVRSLVLPDDETESFAIRDGDELLGLVRLLDLDQREGVLREAWRSVNGDRHDTMIYGLLRREWASGT